MSLLSLLVTTCGLALFSVSLFVSWKLCWVPLSGRFLPDVLKGAHFLGGDQQPVLTEVRRKSRVNYLYEQHLVLMGISCKQKGAVKIIFFKENFSLNLPVLNFTVQMQIGNQGSQEDITCNQRHIRPKSNPVVTVIWCASWTTRYSKNLQ